MKKIVVIISFFIGLACHTKGGIDDFLQKNADKSKASTICSCGKSMNYLLNVNAVELKTPNDIIKKFGKWDTTFSEIAVVSCSSFTYKCDSQFVSFHFDEDNMKFAGRSYGNIIDGKLVNSGNLIEIHN